MLALAAGAVALIATPLLIARLRPRRPRRGSTNAREDERRRVAAHLHDSVLQTLALVQRQAHDPAAVARLARRQEHELRAWMAGEVELGAETLGAALRAAVAEVEDDYDAVVELTLLGERRLDRADRGARRRRARGAAQRRAARAGRADLRLRARRRRTARRCSCATRGRASTCPTVPTERRGVRDSIVGPDGRGRRLRERRVAARRGHGDRAADRGAVMRIVVVDDHHLFRAGVRAELAAHHEVVGEAATPAEALAVIAETKPDVVLLDVHLPDGGGVARARGAARRAARRCSR